MIGQSLLRLFGPGVGPLTHTVLLRADCCDPAGVCNRQIPISGMMVGKERGIQPDRLTRNELDSHQEVVSCKG